MEAPRHLSDVEIMQRFLETTQYIGEMRTATARIEETVNDLKSAQVRCADHATRLRRVETDVSRVWQTVKVISWVVGTLIASAGVIAALAAFV